MNHCDSIPLIEKTQEMAKMGSWDFTPAYNRMRWSSGLYRLLDYSPETDEPTLENLLALIHADDRSLVEQVYTRSFSEGKRHDISYKIEGPSGTVRHIRDKCEHQIKSDGSTVCSYGYLQDVTELEEIRIAQQRSRAESDQFAHIASHDLQEPLRVIIGFLKLLENRYGDQIDAKGRDFIERAVKASLQMELRIRELLSLSQVNTRGALFRETEVDQIFDEVRHRLLPVIENKKAKITCTKLPKLEVDGEQIATLFYHLITNGLQYNASRRPEVSIDCRTEEDGYLLAFSDNGIGIDPQFHRRIFEVFQRLHTQREYQGIGMGLTKCRRIVERHGGAIWVESSPGKGSDFYVRLPAS